MQKLYFLISICIIKISILFSQQVDSINFINLREVLILENLSSNEIDRMPELKDHVIYAGKKSEVIQLDKINADFSSNNIRQIFAKVPGISIWENDGSGIQMGIASRGLSPNRSWEFNVRQSGCDISAEVFGYPESYYNPPMEALKKIEVIRGAASLQYGPQFGGLLNYEIKKGNPNKPISFESQQTVGSYALFNTYNAIGGTYKKFSYYSFFHQRTSDGWRKNSRYNIYTGYFSAKYQLTKKINIGAEYTKMDYKSQQAGGLIDSQFNVNHRQSFRERNWFSAPWNLVSLIVKYDISQSLGFQLNSFATIAERNSVGFTKSINFKDSINPSTLQYNERQIDRDYYKNYGTEARLSVKYIFFGKENIFAGGLRAYSGNTKRNQLGKGTTGNNFDLTLTNPLFAKSLEFTTINYAAFAENIFQLGNRFKIVPGVRLEYIKNQSQGYINTNQTGKLSPNKKLRQILLYGIGSEFKVSEKTNMYVNYSSAFRPVIFSELAPSATSEIIDSNLKDASGFNADFGYRGTVKNFLNFDIGIFYLYYDNRVGIITQNNAPFKTNIGTSISRGVESYIEINLIKIFNEDSKIVSLSIFASNSFIDAKYAKWNNPDIVIDPKRSIEGKRIENAPQYIHRFGTTYCLKGISATYQLSTVGDVFADAVNTEISNSTGTIGKLSGYQIMDVSISYKFLERYNFKGGVNNITDKKYSTRRSFGYPGPGIIPGNGRAIFISFGVSI